MPQNILRKSWSFIAGFTGVFASTPEKLSEDKTVDEAGSTCCFEEL